ncbi:uncharacterized protein LOC124284946 isoform X1 [Haliotis rubra]|uniref:uncharacterized protein LOC124284946 isoform X1 n=1 Tax=Haliotis rubra TaxID=36100 RepID=UPI001EE61F58|nr:uncharacterized protein LOC124284946 isoform X1 [Haliotis rubra]
MPRLLQRYSLGSINTRLLRLPSNYSTAFFFQTLIGDMLQQDPSARPDAGEILSRLLREGYKTTHQDMTASATLTSTMSSTRSSTRTYQGQGQTDSKAVLWSGMDSDTSGIVSDASSMVIHDVSNPPWRDIDKGGKARSARVAVIPPSPGGRSRTKSEGGVPDMDLGLLKFSQLQREKKLSQSKLHKSVTFDQGVLTSKIPEHEVTKGKGEEEAEELMTSEDKGKMLRQIEEVQRSLAQTLGDGVFTAAFSTLNIRTDTKMEKELASVLGDKYDEFGPRFVVLRALEREFTEQRDDRHDMKRKPLNKTI